MWHKVFLHKPLGVYTITLLLLVSSMIFTTWRSKTHRTERLHAHITPTDLQFVSSEHLSAYLDTQIRRPMIGQASWKTNTHRLETQLSAHPFIAQAQLYTHHDGDLHAVIQQHQPIARVIYPNGKNKYLTTTGTLLPLSKRYTAHVPLIYMSNHRTLSLQNFHHTPQSKQWLKLLLFIHSDNFWRAQVSEIHVSIAQELRLYTQISKQVVYLGAAESLSKKLRKLHLFYTEILPKKGWNKYDVVDLRFENQIVCK